MYVVKSIMIVGATPNGLIIPEAMGRPYELSQPRDLSWGEDRVCAYVRKAFSEVCGGLGVAIDQL